MAVGLAVGRSGRRAVPGDDAALAAAVEDRVDGDDTAIFEDARTSWAMLCTSTGRRRVVSGTL